MKRFIAWLLLVTLLLGTFAGCGSNNATPEQTPSQPAAAAAGDAEGIQSAVDYLKAFYKDGGIETFADFERWGTVRIAGVPYNVVWTANVGEDLVKVVDNGDGTVTIDINEDNKEATPYTLTASVTDEAGNTVSHSWDYTLPVGLGGDYCAVVDMAYALEKDQALEFSSTLQGTITAVNTAWSEEYKNITVTIIVEGREDKPIMCYRLKGDDAKDLSFGDLITVSGILKNYNGTIEFDAGCMLEKVEKGAGNLGDIPTDPAEIVTAAYALEVGASLPYAATLTGLVTKIDTPYSADYKNVSVTIQVAGCEDKPILCYRMKGDAAATVMPGDTITVTGTIKNYKGTIEFDAGCQVVDITKGENSMEIPTDPDEILKAAFDLDYGCYLPYPATLTGTVVGVRRYSPQYANRTVTIECGDGYLITCYRMKGLDIDKIWLGDEITVSGNIMNYDGTIEFDAGSIMDGWVDNPDPKAPTDPAEIVAAAYRLSNFSSLPYYCTLTGKVTYVSAWSADKHTANVDMVIEGKPITAYKLSGNGVEAIKVGDTITVWGMLTNYWGTIEFDAGCKLVGGHKETVDDLYNLKPGETMEGEQILTGKITSVEPGAASCNAEMTVNGKTIYCPGLKGSGTDKLEVGDTITVRGTLTNNGGRFQFKSGSELKSWSNKNRPKVNASNTQAEIVEAAKQLGTADYMYGFILNGVITKVVNNYDANYGNITVMMESQGTQIKCYRLKGDGADKIGVGDTIRVSGNLINYNGEIQYTAGCKILSYKLSEKPEIQKPATLREQMEEAVERGSGYNDYTSVTQGKIVGSVTYHSSHDNHSFYVLDEKENIQVYCYAQKLSGYTPETGDTVKVEGKLTSYNGKAQFDYTAKLTLIAKGDGSTPTTPEEPADGSTLTCAEANALGALQGHNQYTKNKYYVTGKITSIANTKYGNMYINDGTGSFYIYGVYDGSTRYDGMENPPQVGDTITVYAAIGQYSGTPQMKNAQLKAHTPAQPAPTEPTVPDATEPPVVETTEPPVPETEPAILPPTAPDGSEGVG